MKTPFTTVQAVRKALRAHSNPERARVSRTFFKTGPGEYAEGDRFLGITVPALRGIARDCSLLADADILALLTSPIHEERLLALILMVERCTNGAIAVRARWYRVYLAHTDFINNWDLVDCSAGYVVGRYLADKSKAPLFRLARSKKLWERRIAMVACLAFITKGESQTALAVAELLVNDTHDLIQKAVGWMLREVGKRCGREEECVFLDRHAGTMPRTMLRYALEHFPKTQRTYYMSRAR